jgi:hypothetical protein
VDNGAGCGGLEVMVAILKLWVRRREMEIDGSFVSFGIVGAGGRKDCGSGYEAEPRTSDIGYID